MSTPPVISALPDVPATSDPQFEIKAPALFNAIKNTFIGEVNSVASWINAGSWLTNPLAVGSGGTGLSTIPAGRILYGNNTSAVSTSANLTYNGTTLSVLGAPSGNPFRAGATSSGDCVALSGMAAGSGAIIAVLNSAMIDYEPLQIRAEDFTVSLRTGVGTDATRLRLTNAGILITNYLTASMTPTDDTNYESVQMFHQGVNGARFVTAGVGTGTVRPFYWQTWNGSTGTVLMTLTASGDLGIGTTSPSARLHILDTTKQLRLGYDVSNYTSLTTDSAGNFIISPTGGGIRINQAPAGSAGAATGTFLRLNLNGTNYKIALQADA